MARNPFYVQVLDHMLQIHDRKNEDYADEENPYSNFEGAARLTGQDVDLIFFTLIGIKAERLRQMVSGKTANFESMEDSILDLAVYASLWLSYLWSLKTAPTPVCVLKDADEEWKGVLGFA